MVRGAKHFLMHWGLGRAFHVTLIEHKPSGFDQVNSWPICVLLQASHSYIARAGPLLVQMDQIGKERLCSSQSKDMAQLGLEVAQLTSSAQCMGLPCNWNPITRLSGSFLIVLCPRSFVEDQPNLCFHLLSSVKWYKNQNPFSANVNWKWLNYAVVRG